MTQKIDLGVQLYTLLFVYNGKAVLYYDNNGYETALRAWHITALSPYFAPQ